MKITEFEAKALRIIQDWKNPSYNITARYFALAMYPDSEKHKKLITHREQGVVRGAGMWLWGGAYLRKLEKKGLVREMGWANKFRQWELTYAGREALKSFYVTNKE